MSDSYSAVWEVIQKNGFETLSRMRVPGGWLVKYRVMQYQGASFYFTFVPDPDHSWKVEAVESE